MSWSTAATRRKPTTDQRRSVPVTDSLTHRSHTGNRQFDIVTHVAQSVRLGVRSGLSVRKAAFAGPAGDGGSVAASVGLAAGKRLARHSGAWALLRITSAVAWVRCPPDLVRTCAKRSRERRELLTYLAQDHRAAADMGTTRAEAEDWANRPFWRP